MKINLRFLLALLPIASLAAAPLTSTTAVHSKPDAASTVLTILSAGTEPHAAVGLAAPLPSGWSAIELDGAHEAYVANRDLEKSLDVKLGAVFRTLPKITAPVLSKMEPGDQVEITGYRGKWTQVKVTKKVVGYVQGWSAAATAPKVAAMAAPTPTPAPYAPPAAPQPFSPAPSAPAAMSGSGPGHASQMVNLGDGGSASLPRLFQGKFLSSRSLLHPRRPYDYQLNDSSGERYGYLDITRLLQTEQIDKYIDHTVTVYGTAKPIEGSKDIVIEVESLQLR